MDVCLFAVEDFACSRNGGAVVVDAIPDEEERESLAVDLLCHDQVGEIVAEHTLLEAYEGQLHDNLRAHELLAGAAPRMGLLAPPGRYTLLVDVGSARQLRRSTTRSIQDKLINWVKVQTLPEPEIPPTVPNHVFGGPPDLALPVVLYRMKCSPTQDGSFQFGFGRPEDLESQRQDRAARALQMKCPKLEASRRPGSTTLLVLETRDFVMSNPWLIGRVVFEEGRRRSDLPDAITCIDTTAGVGHWIAYRVKDPAGWRMGLVED